MEELGEFCESGSRTISIPREWSEAEKAKEFLLSRGYVPVSQSDGEEDDEGSVLSFELPEAPEDSTLLFPQAFPQPQYAQVKRKRSEVSDSSLPWKARLAMQFDTGKLAAEHKLRVKVCVPGMPHLDREQSLSCDLLVQPYVRLDESQLYVKLHVEKLNVGVRHTEFLYGKRDNCRLGYYPYFVKLSLEPVVNDGETPVSLPVYLSEQNEVSQVEAETSLVRNTSATSVGLQLGYGPLSASINHEIARERLVKVEDPNCLVPVEEVDRANVASFEWSILRWEDGSRYRADKPQYGFAVLTRKLPLGNRGNAALLRDFPRAVWRFDRRRVSEESLTFRITVQVKMHLIWFSGIIVKSLGCQTADYQFENYWPLKG